MRVDLVEVNLRKKWKICSLAGDRIKRNVVKTQFSCGDSKRSEK